MPVLAAIAVPHPPVIIPEVGRGREKEIQSTIDAYKKAADFLLSFKPQTIVLTSPHSESYLDYFHISPGGFSTGDLSQFGAPQASVEVDYDRQLIEALTALCEENRIPAGTLGQRNPLLDHGTTVPLLFLRDHLKDVKLVRIGLSGLSIADHYRLGMAISQAADQIGERVVMIASGDLSHKLTVDGPYGFHEAGPEFDKEVMASFASADFLKLLTMSPRLCEKAGECGHRSFAIMAGAFDRRDVAAQVLSYEGPFGVGYGVATFEGKGADEGRNFLDQLEDIVEKQRKERMAKEDAYVRLARLTVETFIKTNKVPNLPDGLPAEMLSGRAGAFVSLHKFNNLRGCMGTTAPQQANIALEIVANGISAATRDPRFPPVTEEELPALEYKVDILNPPEEIGSESELDPKKYGVIVESGNKRGLLLPDLEGVDTVREQVDIARQKGGISPNDKVRLYRFTVTRHY